MPRTRLILATSVALTLSACSALGSSATSSLKAPSPPYAPAPERATRPSVELRTADAPAAASRRARGLRPYEYVFPDETMDVYAVGRGERLVERVSLPGVTTVKGVFVSPRTHVLYLAFGGDGGANGRGSILAYDLVRNRVIWQKRYPTGIDSGAIAPDGRTIYMPIGEVDSQDFWNVIDARTGRVEAEIHTGEPGPHNTLVTLDGTRVFMGPRYGHDVFVASTRTNRIVRRIGPLKDGVRPFTTDRSARFLYTTASDFLGFQVSSVETGKVLYTVPVPGFSIPQGYPLSTPSHGVALAPDGRTLYVLDAANGYVDVFDVSGLPAARPRLVASVKLTRPLTGNASPCVYDCQRFGWLQTSLDGRYVYVGNGGDVIDTRSRRVVAVLPPLRQTRVMIEIAWRGGLPVATSTRMGPGYRPR